MCDKLKMVHLDPTFLFGHHDDDDDDIALHEGFVAAPLSSVLLASLSYLLLSHDSSRPPGMGPVSFLQNLMKQFKMLDWS